MEIIDSLIFMERLCKTYAWFLTFCQLVNGMVKNSGLENSITTQSCVEGRGELYYPVGTLGGILFCSHLQHRGRECSKYHSCTPYMMEFPCSYIFYTSHEKLHLKTVIQAAQPSTKLGNAGFKVTHVTEPMHFDKFFSYTNLRYFLHGLRLDCVPGLRLLYNISSSGHSVCDSTPQLLHTIQIVHWTRNYCLVGFSVPYLTTTNEFIFTITL